jgi:hypothetical protein
VRQRCVEVGAFGQGLAAGGAIGRYVGIGRALVIVLCIGRRQRVRACYLAITDVQQPTVL